MRYGRAVLALILAAAALLCARADTTVHSIEVDGRTRTYRLHVPRAAEKKAPAPLVVVLHGGGGNAMQIQRHARFDALSDREGFLVAYPQGVDGQWNDGRDDVRSTAHREKIDDVKFIAAMLDDVARKHAVDPKRVFVTGISNGGMMSSSLGAHLADRFAAIAPVVGGIPKSWAASDHPSRPLSVLVIQGTDDPLVPYDGGYVQAFNVRRGAIVSTDDALAFWRENNSITTAGRAGSVPDRDPSDGCRVTTTTWSGGRQGTEVVFYKIQGGGHGWPGSSQYLPKRLIGPVCQDFDATETIWSFFRTHPRR